MGYKSARSDQDPTIGGHPPVDSDSSLDRRKGDRNGRGALVAPGDAVPLLGVTARQPYAAQIGPLRCAVWPCRSGVRQSTDQRLEPDHHAVPPAGG